MAAATSASAAGWQVDAVTRSNRRNASTRLMDDLRRRTGTPLPYPSLTVPH